MAVQNVSSLESPTPSSSVSTEITIGHVQLRDLIICPHERGVVNYICGTSIYEHDMFRPGSKRALANLGFIPNTLAALPIPDSTHTLYAAGGQDAELHLSMHSSTSTSSPTSPRRHMRPQWQHDTQLLGSSINNSVMLTRSHVSSAEPRLAVSNNDCTVKFFDVHVRSSKNLDGPSAVRLKEIGLLKIDVPVNHSSLSPDGSTLLSVGDSSQIHLHHISGSSQLAFDPIARYSLAPHTPAALSHQYSYSHYTNNTGPASFSTAFSQNGMKFAVASQEGVAVVWDVRSSKPLKVFETDKSRGKDRMPTGASSGFIYEDTWDWSRGGSRAPGWGIRSIKFSPPGCDGKEIMTFTEHTSLLHVVDTRNFEVDEIIRIPDPLSASKRPYIERRTPRDTLSSYNNPPPPPRIAISASDTTSDEEDDDGVVLIPRLGSSREEEAVQRTLGRHGIRAARPPLSSRRTHSEDDDLDMAEIEEMRRREEAGDYDDAETECLSSAGGSRSSSPIPVANAPIHSFGSSPRANGYLRPRGVRSISSAGVGNLRPARQAPPYPVPSRVSSWSRKEENPEDTLDLAGTCFDPTGSYIYAASVKGVTEYKCRGAEKRWFTSTQWA